jgi:hypothetical protein
MEKMPKTAKTAKQVRNVIIFILIVCVLFYLYGSLIIFYYSYIIREIEKYSDDKNGNKHLFADSNTEASGTDLLVYGCVRSDVLQSA